MYLPNIALITILASTGAFAVAVEIATESRTLVDRNTCVSKTIADEPIYSNAAEDFTLPPGDSKRDLVTLDNVERDEIENGLASRANRHFCANSNNVGVYISDTNSYSAVATGWTLLASGQYRTSTSGRVYPHQFYNNEGIADVYHYCPNGPWFEFPVYSNAARVFGSTTNNPGLDRVIFDLCGNWCATITHRGETGNRFHGCIAA